MAWQPDERDERGAALERPANPAEELRKRRGREPFAADDVESSAGCSVATSSCGFLNSSIATAQEAIPGLRRVNMLAVWIDAQLRLWLYGWACCAAGSLAIRLLSARACGLSGSRRRAMSTALRASGN